MIYPHRVYLVALVADPTARPWVVALCHQFGDGGPAEDAACSTELAAASDPSGPVVGHAMSTPLSDDTFRSLLSLADAGRVPAGVRWAVCDLNDTVTHSNYGPEVIGLPWDMAGALRRVGLAFRESPK